MCTGTPYDYNDPALTGLEVENVAITQVDETTYRGSVQADVTSIQVVPKTNSPFAKAVVNGQVYNGTDPIEVTLQEEGETVITVTVTAEDGTTKDYTLNIEKENGGALAYLTAMKIQETELSPAFASDILEYSAQVGADTETIHFELTPVGNAVISKITVNGISQNTSTEVMLHNGVNTIEIEIVSQDGTNYETYFVTVTKENSDVDKTALQALYDAHKEDELGLYTEESWQIFQNCLEEAEAILADVEASQEQIDAAKTALEKAIENLETIEPADKRTLDALFVMIEGLNSEDYSMDAWTVLSEKVAAANIVKENIRATQEEVDAVCADLIAAINGLESVLNTSAAKAVVSEAEAVLLQQETEKIYRPSDIELVEQYLETVKTAMENSTTTQEELNNSVMDLLNALIQLQEAVNADSLRKLADLAEQILLEQEKYTSSTAKNLEEALNQAKEVLENGDRTKEQVEEAYEQLTKAISELQIRGNKEVLLPLLEKAKEILENQNKYSEKSLEGLEEALTEAQQVYDDLDALQKEINESAAKLAAELAQVRILGDVNKDGKVDSFDAVEVLKANAELRELNSEDASAADVTRDGIIDTNDAVSIQKYVAELITEF